MLCATSALAFARLAQQLVAITLTARPGVSEDEEWFSRYATKLAPNDLEIAQIRETVPETVRRRRNPGGTPRPPE